ncbi:MAG: hypothetical protein ACOY4U_11305 [Pseudomonadota bacterium]
MRRMIVALALIAAVSVVFIHNPFSGYVTATYETKDNISFTAPFGSSQDCSESFGVKLGLAYVGATGFLEKFRAADNEANLLYSKGQSSKLSKAENARLSQLRSDASKFMSQYESAKTEADYMATLCTRRVETEQIERPMPVLQWQAKSPFIGGLATIKSLLMALSFISIISLIAFFAVPKSAQNA